MLLAQQNGRTSCCLKSSTTRWCVGFNLQYYCDQNMKQIQNTNHKVYTIGCHSHQERDCTRYKMGGKFKYL